MTAFVYEWERYLEGKVQILGVSVDAPEEGQKLIERVTRDCREDRPHIPLDPYPVRLLTDPDAKLIRAVGTETKATGRAQSLQAKSRRQNFRENRNRLRQRLMRRLQPDSLVRYVIDSA